MNVPLAVVTPAGSVALLLRGVRTVLTGVQRAPGRSSAAFRATPCRTGFKAFLAGAGVTAILQSSTATGVMITGFAAGGLVERVPARAVMLGADVGTTPIVQVLSFNVNEAAPALIPAGVMMVQRATAGPRDFGRGLIGLGLILMARNQFVEALSPYTSVPTPGPFLGAIATQRFLDVLLAAGLTWAVHASVAVVLVVMSFAASGTIPPEAAFALVLGANLGTAINPVLEGASGEDPVARRVPFGNLLNRIIGVAVALSLLPRISHWLARWDRDPGCAVADFHTAFNLVVAALFLPLLAPYAALLRRWLPARRPGGSEPSLVSRPGAREAPVVALGGAGREALRLSDVLETMLTGFRDARERNDRRLVAGTGPLDDVIDKLNRGIKAYIASLDSAALGEADHRRVHEILAYATDTEQAGDIVAKDLLGIVGRKIKRGRSFSESGQADLMQRLDRLAANVRTAASLFMTGDERAARLLASENAIFHGPETAATDAHFERLRAGRIETAETSACTWTPRDSSRMSTRIWLPVRRTRSGRAGVNCRPAGCAGKRNSVSWGGWPMRRPRTPGQSQAGRPSARGAAGAGRRPVKRRQPNRSRMTRMMRATTSMRNSLGPTKPDQTRRACGAHAETIERTATRSFPGRARRRHAARPRPVLALVRL